MSVISRCPLPPTLVRLYERALLWLRNLRAVREVVEVEVVHVYREYNGDADGICNEVLDSGADAVDTHGYVINRGWR